ncbi:MAG TPA: hypothetical protein VHQ90_20065 [Thermoanaerobaculia bacterium]|nr:hypothetical protein [Thermoanaerobaculia bacterium]
MQYPPLFPLTVGALMGSGSPRAAFLVLAGMNVLTLGLLMLLLQRGSGEAETRRPFSLIEMGFAGLGAATALVGHQMGRPEALATPLALVTCVAMVRLAALPAHWWIIGPLIGLTGAVHPLGAVELSLLYCAVLSFYYPMIKGLGTALRSSLAAAAVFAGILAASPFGLTASVGGTWSHARIHSAFLRGSIATAAWYWTANATASLYALPYLAALGLLAWFLLTGRLAPRSKTMFTMAAFGLGAIAWLTAIHSPELCYNVLLFAPLVFWWNVYATQRLGSIPARIAVTTCSVFASLGFLRFVVLLFFFLRSGVPLAEARSAFAGLAGHTAGPIAITTSFWVLSENYDRMEIVTDVAGYQTRSTAVMIQQNYSGLTAPPRIPGFVLLEDRFKRDSCELFRIRLAHTFPGYGFATYRRTERGSPAR